MGTESGAATTIVTERMAGRGAFLTPYSRRAYARAGEVEDAGCETKRQVISLTEAAAA